MVKINMSSLQEVTNQLMKSVQELADWEYPLSEILEKYYALLENPTEINFGEAALVVQNSVEVFTKRVDCLGKEVCNLCKNFLQHEAEEEKAKAKSKEKRSRKTVIDFGNFEPINFQKEVGKNINLKPSSQKPVKLLNRRFPQLEAAVTHLLTPIEVLDIQGEIIGKKYDFRCNQQLTINGILVDECMPQDFCEQNLEASNQVLLTDRTTENGISVVETTNGGENNTVMENSTMVENSTVVENSTMVENSTIEENSTVMENNTIDENITRIENTTSIVHSTMIENTIAPDDKTTQEDTGYFSLPENVTNEQTTTELDKMLNPSEEITETVSENLNIVQGSPESDMEVDCMEETPEEVHHFDDNVDHDDYTEDVEAQLPLENTTPAELVPNEKESEVTENQVDTVSDNNNQPNQLKSQQKEQKTSNNTGNLLHHVNSSKKAPLPSVPGEIVPDSRDTDKNSENPDQEDENRSVNSRETDSGYRSSESEDFEIPRRRSKRMKNMVCVVNDLNKNVWKPIPFDQGIPQKLPKSRSKFKLPCHISLLKAKRSSRKRKLSTEEGRRKDSLQQFLISGSELPLKKLNMYSPSRPFTPLKTEELNDFQKSFDDCFKSRQCYDVFHYEAATTITKDLLGFFPSFTKKDPLSSPTVFKTLAPTPEHVSASCSDPGFSPRAASPGIVIFDTDSPPNSPIMSETFDEEPPLHSTANYTQLIESRMKEIYEEFDVRTDLEQSVARWHQIIQPKLREQENRPPFHIQDYSERIVQRLEETEEHRMSFDTLVVDQPRDEAVRYFSAALQLANTYNVDIQTSDAKTDIELFLLNSTISRQEVFCETPKSSKTPKTKRFKRNA